MRAMFKQPVAARFSYDESAWLAIARSSLCFIRWGLFGT